MKYKALRALRVLLASCMLLCVASFFLDFDGKIPEKFVWFEKVQFYCAIGSLLWFVIFASVLLVGRLYCSVICPLGILQDLISWVAGKSRQILSRFTKDPKTGKPKPLKNWKNNVFRANNVVVRSAFFIFACVTGFAGVLVFGLLEPYSIFGRIAVNVFKPLYVIVNNILFAIYGPEKSFYYVDVRPESYGALLVGVASFVMIALFAGKAGRLYCNLICPVGSFLGFFSRWALVKTYIKQDKCISCGLCAKACKSSCIDSKGKVVDNSRCVVCFDCFSACRKDAIAFGVNKKPTIAPNEIQTDELSASDKKLDAETLQQKRQIQSEMQGFDRSKRNFITLSAMAAAATAAKAVAAVDKNTIFIGDAADTSDSKPMVAADGETTAGGALSEEGEVQYTGHEPIEREFTISPPGSRSHEHMLRHCISCHLCVAKCPSHVLKPSGFENGLQGFLQPRMDFSHGFCNFDCTTCADVCPANAILPLAMDGKSPLTMEEKHKIQVGHVVFVKENCIVPVLNQHCGACSEHCPTQAVHMVPYGDNGLTIPETNVDLCVGCGGCEYICPARPNRAIYIEGNPVHIEATPPPKEESKVVEEVDFGF